jgi:predicted lipid-binding transport protein (Tim44 family)
MRREPQARPDRLRAVLPKAGRRGQTWSCPRDKSSGPATGSNAWTVTGAALVVIVWALAVPASALALGGGGVGGFGGGGGGGGSGGGGGGYGGGGGFGGGGLGALFHWLASRRAEQRQPFTPRHVRQVLRHLALWPVDAAIEWRRLRRRKAQVRLAAAEASEDDPHFAPELVAREAERLFRGVQAAWTADNRSVLASLVSKDLMVEWERRLKGFAQRGWTNEIEVKGPVHVDYVGLRNASDERSKRAVVRIAARVRDVVIDKRGSTIHRVNSVADTHHVCEYWTLGLLDDRWTLLSIEQHHEGLHQLTEPVFPTPWSDTRALQREATIEQAASARVENSQIGEIAGATLSNDAHAAALDISLIDDRFAPRVLAAAVDDAVGAWVEAIDGDDAPLHAVASPAAVNDLLYPGDPTSSRRIVVRAVRVRSVDIVELAARAQPPAMTVQLNVSGHRYEEDRTTTTVLSGDRSTETQFTLRWRMELSDDPTHPWSIAAVLDAGAGKSTDLHAVNK